MTRIIFLVKCNPRSAVSPDKSLTGFSLDPVVLYGFRLEETLVSIILKIDLSISVIVILPGNNGPIRRRILFSDVNI